MDSKQYFKINRVKLTKTEHQAIKIGGMLTRLSLKYEIPPKEITKIEAEVEKLSDLEK